MISFQIQHNAVAGPIAARLIAAAAPLDMIAPLVPSFAVVPSSAVAAAVELAVAAPWAFAWERASSSVAPRSAAPSELASYKVPSYSPVDTLALLALLSLSFELCLVLSLCSLESRRLPRQVSL